MGEIQMSSSAGDRSQCGGLPIVLCHPTLERGSASFAINVNYEEAGLPTGGNRDVCIRPTVPPPLYLMAVRCSPDLPITNTWMFAWTAARLAAGTLPTLHSVR